MLSLPDLRLVLCSRDLDVLRAQRIMGFFILITHKSTRSEIRSRGYERFFIVFEITLSLNYNGLLLHSH